MMTTEPSAPHVGEHPPEDELRDALIREARQRARRRRTVYVGAAVLAAVAAIAAWSTASSGGPGHPGALDDLRARGPRTSAAASPTTTSAATSAPTTSASVPLGTNRFGPPPGMALIAPGPTYSPDGTTIVYQARDDRTGRLGELYVEVSGKERTQITHLDLAYSPTAVFAMAPRFTADGQTVLFMLPSGGVWSVPVTGGEPTLVIAHGMWPVPLPDGKTVAYLSAPVIQSDGRHIFGHSDVWVVRLDNPGSARLVGTVPFDNSTWGGVSVSSDGTKLVYGEIEIDIASGHSTSP